MTPRDAEIARYVALYGAAGTGYRTTPRRLALFRALLDERPDLLRQDLLDVGAGHGTMLAEAQTAGYRVLHGTEVVPALARGNVRLAPAWALPFPDRSMGTVACFDVLEHLLPDDVPAALAEMSRVASHRILIEVSCRPSNWRDEHGQLHMTIWTPETWIAAAARAWDEGWRLRVRDDRPTETAAVVIEATRSTPTPAA